MIAYLLIYAFLATLITYVMGVSWSTSKPHEDNQENPQDNIRKTHR